MHLQTGVAAQPRLGAGIGGQPIEDAARVGDGRGDGPPRRVDEDGDAGFDALGLVGERIGQRRRIADGDGSAKAVVGGEQRRRAAQPLGVLRQHAPQQQLAGAHALGDFAPAVGLDAAPQRPEAGGLHEQQKAEEHDHDAPMQVAHDGAPHRPESALAGR